MYATPEVIAAVKSVLHYNWPDEIRDAVEQRRENGEVKGHVFESLVVLGNWVTGSTKTMDQYLDEEEGCDA